MSASPSARVVIVDDDVEYCATARDVLTGAGYAVEIAHNGEDALTVMRAGAPPDAVLLDLLMPRKNGWQVWDEMQLDARLRRVPVIVVTSTGLTQGALGPAPVISKNTRADALLRRLAAVLVDKTRV
jgi:CheY-like chemotaxis protein